MCSHISSVHQVLGQRLSERMMFLYYFTMPVGVHILYNINSSVHQVLCNSCLKAWCFCTFTIYYAYGWMCSHYVSSVQLVLGQWLSEISESMMFYYCGRMCSHYINIYQLYTLGAAPQQFSGTMFYFCWWMCSQISYTCPPGVHSRHWLSDSLKARCVKLLWVYVFAGQHTCQPLLGVNCIPEFFNLYFPYPGGGPGAVQALVGAVGKAPVGGPGGVNPPGGKRI